MLNFEKATRLNNLKHYLYYFFDEMSIPNFYIIMKEERERSIKCIIIILTAAAI